MMRELLRRGETVLVIESNPDDRFLGPARSLGAGTSREPDGFAAVSLKLGQYRKLDPSPLEAMIFFDHPSGRARIRMAMDWKAEHLPAAIVTPPLP